VRRVLAATMLLVAAGCGGGETTDGREVTVFAASSLTAPFTELADLLQERSLRVTLNVGASDALAAQIASEGAADVFASASERWMDAVADTPGVTHRVDVATNGLIVVTPPDDPAKIASVADLARPGVQLILAAEGAPVGDYAREVLRNAGILDQALANVVSFEEDNAAVVAKVAAGEADAGVVFASDADAGLRVVALPDEVNVTAVYPVAIVAGAAHPDAAAAFVEAVTSAEGRAILERHGFGPPPGG
jgi:molybdate transport system substrate-binding protein